MIHTLPLRSLSRQYPSFLSEPSGEPNVLLGSASPMPERLRDLSRFTPEHRAALAEGIGTDLRRWNAPESAQESAEQLRKSEAYAVVTGQQAGVAGGPLYTFYKAVGTIRAAEALGRAFPDHLFVPVFWIEGDDHDFDEARTVTLPEPNGDPRTIRYDDGDDRRLHVGDRRVDPEGLRRFIDEAHGILGETDFSADLFACLEEVYSGDETTLADGFGRWFYALLGETPLVLVSSRNPALKRLAAEIFAAEAEKPENLYEALRTRSRELADRSLTTPIDPKPGALFLTHEGERRSLNPDGEEYSLRGTESRMSREEAAKMARENPERFSPNVALRPVVQDGILPTAIYLGGPSEIAYLRQLRDAYPLFGMEQPLLAPRPFVTLLEPKVPRILESSGTTLEQMFDPEFDPAAFFTDQKKSEELTAALEGSRASLAEAFAGLEKITGEIDKSLEHTLGATARKAEKELENFGHRLHAALKRKNETEIHRLEGARTLLLPGGKLQERSLNILYYANKYGIERIREALGAITLTPGEMEIIAL